MRVTTERLETIAANDYESLSSVLGYEFKELALDLLETRKPKHYLITYIHRYLGRADWTYHNQALDTSPSEWVREWTNHNGGTFVLLFAMEISPEAYVELREVL